MNTFLNTMKSETNYTLTENCAITHKSTLNDVLDMFAMGGAYRGRTDDDCINLFKNAFEQDPTLALKCLFYLGDCRGGQGERRFFRVCFSWLAKNHTDVARKNMELVPEYRRWDDLIYSCLDTPLQQDMLAFIQHQFALDLNSKTPSLLGKWMPSENASSAKTKAAAGVIRTYLNLSHKQYRKALSHLRSKINIVEKLMSEGRWDEIEFDKIPSRAGLIYRNAFARQDMIAEKYRQFAESKATVNAGVLYPIDIAHRILKYYDVKEIDQTERAMFQKYWDNLPDYYEGREENGLCVVDVSGSMWGIPVEAAVSLGAYIAERGHGPFANHFITFSAEPKLVRFEGVDIADKFIRCRNADWGWNTNIEAVFDLLLTTAKDKNTKPEDIPSRLYILSDMEFDAGLHISKNRIETLLESIARKWREAGYELPQVIFWNLRSSHNNIPALGGRFGYVSGYSPSILKALLTGKDGWDLCLEVLLSPRYEKITAEV